MTVARTYKAKGLRRAYASNSKVTPHKHVGTEGRSLKTLGRPFTNHRFPAIEYAAPTRMRKRRAAFAADQQIESLAFLVGEKSACGLAAFLAVGTVPENVEAGRA
jgi:hypothetical protein